MKRLIVAVAIVLPAAGTARANEYGDQDLRVQAHTGVDSESRWPIFTLTGQLRARGGLLYNLDLDRGLATSGQPLFPVSASDPAAQATSVRDLRLRTDITARSRGGMMNGKLRLDVLDTMSDVESFASAAGRATDTGELIHLRRAYAEILTPVGVLVVGRMASEFGLGMLVNGGDCPDCDGGDTADRIALVIPTRGYLVAAAVDLGSSIRPFGARADYQPSIDPRNKVHAVTAMAMRYHSDSILEIRRRGGRATIDYGASTSYVWQRRDTPADYLLDEPGDDPATIERGFGGVIASGWFRYDHPTLRLEAEVALVAAKIAQASLIPGALFRDPVELRQTGAALESEYGALNGPYGAGLDAGFASGDPAPGFGAFPTLASAQAQPGDLDGVQARPPADNRIDNFRFSPSYQIDQILFRQIIGTVTDAIYLRPHARARLLELGPGTLSATLVAIASWAVEASSTPSGQRALGLELDSAVTYRTPGGLVATLSHAVLLPGAGLDNPTTGAAARPAQALELLVGYLF